MPEDLVIVPYCRKHHTWLELRPIGMKQQQQHPSPHIHVEFGVSMSMIIVHARSDNTYICSLDYQQ